MAYTTIDDPSEYFQTAIYSGNSSTLAVVNDGNSNLQPDWVWVKRRNSSSTHALVDSSRGRAKSLGSEATDAEFNTSDTSKDLISFDTDGFTVGQPNQRNMNGNGDSFVAWQWKANGGTTTTNTDGDTNVTLQANATAGFSIGTWNASGSNPDAVGHGLGAAPEMIIVKRRDSTSNWHIWHQGLGDGNNYILLNSTGAKSNDSFEYVSSIGSSTVSLAGGPGSNTDVAYFFRSIKGYSKFGFYTGNGNSDGTFIYTGFKPAWVMIKRTDSTNNWNIFDSKRDVDNQVGNVLYANQNYAEEADASHSSANDFLSNGFKLRETGNAINGSGASYIYMAFAEHPFVSSKGVPTTAR